MLLSLFLSFGFLHGFLSPPSREPPEMIARRFARLTLKVPTTELGPSMGLRTESFDVIRLSQRHSAAKNLAVDGGDLSFLIDKRGRVRLALGRFADLRHVPATPRLSAEEAVRRALAYLPHRAEPPDERLAELVVYAREGQARLAFRVTLSPNLAFLEAPRLYIDAVTGALLRKEDRIRFAKEAFVYKTNPIASPSPYLVTLTEADDAEFVRSSAFEAFNCVDQHESVEADVDGTSRPIHHCSIVRKAARDTSKNWLFDPGSADDPEDPFTEPHLFYHANRIADLFRELGFGGPGKLRLIGNYRLSVDPANLDRSTAWDANGPLFPFNNAFFIPGGDLFGLFAVGSASLVFGQGGTDFGCDGDVVYHEYGHAVINATSDIAYAVRDEFGIDVSGGAINEGYADFFAAVLSGDPEVAEFAARGLGRASIRNLANTEICADALFGEVHQDSKPFSAALWTLHTSAETLGTTSLAIDKVIFATMVALPGEVDFAAVANATVAALGASIGPAAAQFAESTFRARGLYDCRQGTIYRGPRERIYLENWQMSPYTPGVMQLRYELDAPASGLDIRVDRVAVDRYAGLFRTPGVVLPVVIVKKDERVRVHHQGALPVLDAEVDLEVRADETGFAHIPGPLAKGSYYIMFANRGDERGSLRGVSIARSENSQPPPDAAGPERDASPDAARLPPDAGVSADGGGDEQALEMGEAAGGCHAAPLGGRR